MTDIRRRLDELIRTRGESYASVSGLLGRNPAYVQQFMKRGTPRELDARDLDLLARYFAVQQGTLADIAGREQVVRIPKLAVRASAGPGATNDAEYVVGGYRFDRNWLRSICHAALDQLSLIKVAGDSMSPTLNDGDDALVDRSDGVDRLRDGIYVLRRDETLMVKRVALGPGRGLLRIVSDNSAYPSFADTVRSDLDVVGRVVWIGRSVG